MREVSSPPISPATKAADPTGDTSLSVWDEWSGLLAELADTAHAAGSADRFYKQLLRTCVTALSANDAAAWFRDSDGRIARRYTTEANSSTVDALPREKNIAAAIASREPQIGDASDEVSIAAPVAEESAPEATVIIELLLASGQPPSYYANAKRLLEAVAEIAAEWRLREELQTLRAAQATHGRMATLARHAHATDSLERTAMRLVNAARDALDCDRASIVGLRAGRAQLLAVSGAERVDRRSTTARAMQDLAELAAKLDEPLLLLEGDNGATNDDAIDDALHRYADASHARQVIAYPLALRPEEDDEALREAIGVLIVEQFDIASGDLQKPLVAEAAELCAPAIATAQRWDRLPLAGVLSRAAGGRPWRRATKWAMGLAIIAAAVATTFFIPAELSVEARGELQPVERHGVFAPRDGVVTAVQVSHGDKVAAGDSLATLRDADLQVEAARLAGLADTTRRQLDAVQSLRRNMRSRSADPVEEQRLSAEQQSLATQLESIAEQQALVRAERERLQIESPAAGAVVSWRLEDELLGRPVARGQRLMQIANTTGDWRLELRIDDDRLSHLLEAIERNPENSLQVAYRVASEEAGSHTAHVMNIAQRAGDDPDSATGRSIEIFAMPSDPRSPVADPQTLRPGQTVYARIACGERSLAYVWLHDVWNTVRTWWEY